MIKLDKLDKDIVDLLIEDGRMSSADIARQLGDVPARKVSYRIRRLVENNIIKIRAVVDRAEVGYPVIADVFFEIEPGRVQEVAETLTKIPEVGYVAIVMGSQDISIQVFGRSIEHLQRLISEKIHRIPGVRRSLVNVVAQRLHVGHEKSIPSEMIED